MDDPWNVTAEELAAWAADPDEGWPEQDWDLAVAREDLADEVLRLAVTPDCPKRHFFLRILYLFVGDAVRSKWAAHGETFVRALLDEGSRREDPSIRLWVKRSRELLAHPERFEYSDWCDGGLARTGEDAESAS